MATLAKRVSVVVENRLVRKHQFSELRERARKYNAAGKSKYCQGIDERTWEIDQHMKLADLTQKAIEQFAGATIYASGVQLLLQDQSNFN
jgi:hypothetical protein